MPPFGIALLVATKGDAGLPLGKLAEFGTGEARFGGADEGPLGVAASLPLVADIVT